MSSIAGIEAYKGKQCHTEHHVALCNCNVCFLQLFTLPTVARPCWAAPACTFVLSQLLSMTGVLGTEQSSAGWQCSGRWVLTLLYTLDCCVTAGGGLYCGSKHALVSTRGRHSGHSSHVLLTSSCTVLNSLLYSGSTATGPSGAQSAPLPGVLPQRRALCTCGTFFASPACKQQCLLSSPVAAVKLVQQAPASDKTMFVFNACRRRTPRPPGMSWLAPTYASPASSQVRRFMYKLLCY